MLPYCVVNCFALSPTCCSIARRSLRSSSSRPLSSAILKASVSTPACVSLRPSMRASSSGPISEIVARTGWPCSPNTSQNTTGHASNAMSSSFKLLDALLDLALGLARLRQPGEIALHVGHEHRHADAARALGDALQRHGLAGAGGAGDQPVAVGVVRAAGRGRHRFRDEQRFGHGGSA